MLIGIGGGAGIFQYGDGVVPIVPIPGGGLNGPAGAHPAQIEVIDVIGPQCRLQRRTVEGADPGLGQHQIPGCDIQLGVEVGAAIVQGEGAELVSPAKHGEPLGCSR